MTKSTFRQWDYRTEGLKGFIFHIKRRSDKEDSEAARISIYAGLPHVDVNVSREGLVEILNVIYDALQDWK